MGVNPTSQRSGGSHRRVDPASIARIALIVIALVGAACSGTTPPAEEGSDSGVVDETGDGVDTDDTTEADTDPDPDPDPDTDDESEPDVPEPSRPVPDLRVAFDAVRADTDDPYLNVRLDPDPRADILAKLPPMYAGLSDQDETETVDGETWRRVELLDSVPLLVSAIDRPGEGTAGRVLGWVNERFVQPAPDGLAVGTDEVPACAASENTTSGLGDRSGDAASDLTIHSFRSARLSEDCVRTVIGFGVRSDEGTFTDLAVVEPLPAVPDHTITTFLGTLDLGDTSTVWPRATDSSYGYVARDRDGGLSAQLGFEPAETWVTPLPGRGLLILDAEPRAEVTVPSSSQTPVILRRDMGENTITVSGLARPFEATLDAAITDESGRPVEALWSGGYAGTIRADRYGLMTTDWIEAWGRFDVQAVVPEPGPYELVISAEDPSGRTSPSVSIPFEPTGVDADSPAPRADTDEPTERDNEIALALLRFARTGEGFDDLGLAPEVEVGLGFDTAVRTVPASGLESPSAWRLDVDQFNGWSGPFDILPDLTRPTQISAGEITHCAGPPLTVPNRLEGLRRVNLEPFAITSCLEWRAVTVFLDTEGRIAAVHLDLWEP